MSSHLGNLLVKDDTSRLGVSPTEGGWQMPLIGGSGRPGILRAAMRPTAAGCRIVEAATEEGF